MKPELFDFSKELTASLYGSQHSSKVLSRLQTLKDEDLFPENQADVNESNSPWMTKGVMHPEGWFHMTWDLAMMFLLVHQAFYVPYELCFNIPATKDSVMFDVFVNVIFMCDILISFNTGVLEKGSLVMSRNKIALNYARFWLWLDIIASFPYDWVINGDPMTIPSDASPRATRVPRLLRILKMVRFFRMLRLLRLAKLRKLMMKIEDVLSNTFIVMLFLLMKLLIVVFFIAHVTASFWYYVSDSESELHPVTWISNFEINSKRALDYNDFYIAALYWAFTTMATVGFGDFVPFTAVERLYAIMCMIVACGLFAYTVGSIGNIVAKQGERSTENRNTVLRTNAYMKRFNLPRELQFRVRRYLDFKWDTEDDHFIDEESVMSMLSDPLRNEICAFIHGGIIKSCPPILGFTDSFIQQLTKTFRSEIFAPGDSIFNEGELSFHLYFVQSGTVDVYHKGTNTTFRELSKGSYFGEVGFFTGHTRWASLRCLLFTSLLTLSVDSMKELTKKNPEAEDYLLGVKERCKDGNYSTLEVVCYICGKNGHVALRCDMAIVNLDHSAIKKRWLHGKLFRESVKVNPYFGEPPNFQRVEKKVVRAVGLDGKTGGKNSSKHTKDRPNLLSRIKGFLTSQRISFSKVVPAISDELETPAIQRRGRHYSAIYKDSDSDNEEETPSVLRAPSNKKNFSSFAVPENDMTLDQSLYRPRMYNPPSSPVSIMSDSEMLNL